MKLDDASFRVLPFDPDSTALDSVLDVYCSYTPYSRAEGRRYVRRYAREPDFRGFVAEVGGSVVAMAFGARVGPGNWWWDAMTTGLGELAEDLEGAWTLNELAVLQPWRRRGIATTLLRVVEGSIPGDKLILSTGLGNLPARALYASCGWRERGVVQLSAGAQMSVIYVRDRSREE